MCLGPRICRESKGIASLKGDVGVAVQHFGNLVAAAALLAFVACMAALAIGLTTVDVPAAAATAAALGVVACGFCCSRRPSSCCGYRIIEDGDISDASSL